MANSKACETQTPIVIRHLVALKTVESRGFQTYWRRRVTSDGARLLFLG